MEHVESKVSNPFDPTSAPILYLRYVEDILLVLSKIQTLRSLKENFEANSVLKFTCEVEAKNGLPFQDCTVMKTSHRLPTDIHVKETNTGECLNYYSFAPRRYKTGVIKTMLNRAYNMCSNWGMMHKEITRLKQMFINNKYP